MEASTGDTPSASASSPPEGGRYIQPGIEDYAILGDCRTAALVSRAGSIDWFCLPRFDGPSVFGAILDPDAGRFQLRPVADFDVERSYRRDTNVLETTFRTDSGELRLTDAMTVPRHPEGRQGIFPDHELLRRVEGLSGEVEVEVVCDPRFDYGRRVPRVRRTGVGVLFDGGVSALLLRSEIPGSARSDRPGWAGRATLRAGDVRRVSLASEHAAPVVVVPLGEAADRRLEGTTAWWRDWADWCAYDGEYRDEVYRSMLTLKLLTFPPSGAILAAPTTSLPEVPGGSRNWDYRYCWLRDASMTMEVLLHLGYAREAESFLAWLLHATRLTRPELQVLYDVYGRHPSAETELAALAGYHGARPVRVGNGAANQIQLDIYGELLRAARSFVEEGGRIDHAEGRLLADLGETVCARWRDPDQGIWEVRHPKREWTLSKAMCWVALDCLLALHDQGGVPLRRSRAVYEEEMARIREAVDERGWSASLESYVAWLDGDVPDAALLILGLAGYDEPDSDRMRGTLRRVEEELGVDGLLYRYRYDDGQPGREGAFGIASFWRAELLARQGRVDAAREAFEHACSFANDVGLMAEEIDPDSGTLLGNFPQAFTHIGLVSAAKEISRARGRPPEEARQQEPASTRATREP